MRMEVFDPSNETALVNHYNRMLESNKHSGVVDTVYLRGIGEAVLFSDTSAREAYGAHVGLQATGSIVVKAKGDEIHDSLIPWGIK